MSTITPHLTIRGAAAAIEFYKKVFGAELVANMPDPGGKIMCAELKIGDSFFSLSDDFPEMEEKLKTHAGIMGSCAPSASASSPVVLRVDTEDCDRIFQQAVAAGAKAQMPPTDVHWGYRYCKFADPFGHNWWVATCLDLR
jgi:uncharacterized glyoxalase superfamily protein PhnB